MVDLIKAHQLDIMLILCGACGILFVLLVNTRFLSKKRKAILIFMELVAFFLLWFDRLAYIYAGDPSQTGFIMLRISNFAVFLLTSGIVFGFNLYIADLMRNEGKLESLPKRLYISGAVSVAGMLLALIAAFTDLYYYFDETNHYHRGQGFLIAYIIPVDLCFACIVYFCSSRLRCFADIYLWNIHRKYEHGGSFSFTVYTHVP